MLNKFMRQIRIRNRSSRTINILENALFRAERGIGKPLETASFEDILTYIEALKKDLGDNTIFLHEQRLLQFYRYCFDETDDIRYNKLIKQLKSISSKKHNHINPAELILPEDVKRLINVSTIERDRCIVASFWESGMRIGELLALTNDMVMLNEQTQEVIFNVPNTQGCKTGARTIVCVELYGYVQDWLKCNTSSKFIPVSGSGVRKIIEQLFNKAGISKPCNVHMFRHSAITHWVSLGMQHSVISLRAWGIPNSSMLSTYIHLSEQMQADGYKNAKGMMNGEATKVINPIACRCVECGKLIQSGSLCKQCRLNQELQSKVRFLEKKIYELREENNDLIEKDIKEGMARIKRDLKRGELVDISNLLQF